jgi:integrase
MATVRKLDSGKWQVIVRRKGHSPVSKTFQTRSDCDKWARHIESDIDRGAYTALTPVTEKTIGELIDRYIEEVSPTKKSCKSDVQRLRYLRRHFGRLSVSALRSNHVAQWRDKRLNEGKSGSTVIKEIGSLSHLLDTAIKDWGIAIPSNPVKQVRKPKVAGGRERRISTDELAALQQTKIGPIVTLAVETGMRLGELIALEWSLIDFGMRTAVLPVTKNGEKRVVPLSSVAVKTLELIPRNGERVFLQWKCTDSFEKAWQRTLLALKNANTSPDFLADLRFHDLRHEAASRFFERGLSVMEVATITGHKTLAMLRRYTHLRAEDLAKRLS